jgi:hypothetical protein
MSISRKKSLKKKFFGWRGFGGQNYLVGVLGHTFFSNQI